MFHTELIRTQRRRLGKYPTKYFLDFGAPGRGGTCVQSTVVSSSSSYLASLPSHPILFMSPGRCCQLSCSRQLVNFASSNQTATNGLFVPILSKVQY